jgi:osmoprotectant transport system ATP-binding protein
MIENPVTCTPDLPLSRCLENMRMRNVNSLMVVEGENQKLQGIIKAKQIAKQKDRSIEVNHIMLKDFITTHPEDTIINILKMVNTDDVSEIPVLDERGMLIGLITQSSLVNTLSQQYIVPDGEVE